MSFVVSACRSKSLCVCVCEPDPGSVSTPPHTVKKQTKKNKKTNQNKHYGSATHWLNFDTKDKYYVLGRVLVILVMASTQMNRSEMSK